MKAQYEIHMYETMCNEIIQCRLDNKAAEKKRTAIKGIVQRS